MRDPTGRRPWGQGKIRRRCSLVGNIGTLCVSRRLCEVECRCISALSGVFPHIFGPIPLCATESGTS